MMHINELEGRYALKMEELEQERAILRAAATLRETGLVQGQSLREGLAAVLIVVAVRLSPSTRSTSAGRRAIGASKL